MRTLLLMGIYGAVLCGMSLTSRTCKAEPTGTFCQQIDSASTIVVGQLEQFMPDAADEQARFKPSAVLTVHSGPPDFSIQARGTYTFTVIGVLRGQPPQPMVVQLPRVNTSIGVKVGEVAVSVPLHAPYLLLLKTDQTGRLVPVGNAPIPISPKVELPKPPIADARSDLTTSAIIGMLLESLKDPPTQGSSAMTLEAVISPAVASAMRKYMDDPDDRTRIAVLQCLANNQDISAIPKIAGFHYTGATGNPFIRTLTQYKTPDAIPYLTEVVNTSTQAMIRNSAAEALMRLPQGKETIPFWLKTLHDPDPTDRVSYNSYVTLHKLIPELGPAGAPRDFMTNKAQQIEILETWWADEQAGKHKAGAP